MSLVPHSLTIAELTQKSQIGFVLTILLTQSISSILYFFGYLIKQIFFPEKPTPPEEVI
jgi:hypothetical protein